MGETGAAGDTETIPAADTTESAGETGTVPNHTGSEPTAGEETIVKANPEALSALRQNRFPYRML